MIGYIYLITNLLNGKLYVGQTMHTIAQRFSGHKSSARNGNDATYLHKAITKYGEENFSIKELHTVEANTKEDLRSRLNTLEKHYILEYNTLAPNGYNLTKGGSEGAEWQKRKVDEYDIYGIFIRTHDALVDVSREYGYPNSCPIRECCIGRSKYAYNRIWRYHGDPLEKFELPNSTVASRDYKQAPIDQYSKDGHFIQSFDSIIEACLSLGKNESSSHIAECCMGKLYSAYGYVWRYRNEPFNKYVDKDKRFKGCKKYSLDGELLGVYSSIYNACISIGEDPKRANPNIAGCCKGRKKTAYGYKWEYA